MGVLEEKKKKKNGHDSDSDSDSDSEKSLEEEQSSEKSSMAAAREETHVLDRLMGNRAREKKQKPGIEEVD